MKQDRGRAIGASSFTTKAIAVFKKSRASTPIGAFFSVGKAMGISVTVQGMTEAAWKALVSQDEEAVYEKLEHTIRVKAGREALRFDWCDERDIELVNRNATQRNVEDE